jgi:ABC-type transporter Mla maintaining outer membrane lipid asymmetry ATPase subunit MlaF
MGEEKFFEYQDLRVSVGEKKIFKGVNPKIKSGSRRPGSGVIGKSEIVRIMKPM